MNITLFKTMALTAAIVVTNSIAAPAIDQDTKSWVSGVNTQLNTTFSSADPNVVPSFSTNATGTEHYMENPNLMASDSVTEAATDEAAQLMRGIPQKPDVANEVWYQNAHNITKNPKDELGGLTGEYTDCVEVTTPGATHSEIQTCTETANTTTASCTSDLKIEVDSDHFYSCKKELNTTNENCTVGRVIDVTQSHRYSCQEGRISYTKSCSDKLEVTIERSSYKYRPTLFCRYNKDDLTTNGFSSENSNFMMGQYIHFKNEYLGGGVSAITEKKSNACDIIKNHTSSWNGSSWETILINGIAFDGCRDGDELWEDGYCHTTAPIGFVNAIPTCTNAELENNMCNTTPSWIEDFLNTNNLSTQRSVWYNGSGYYTFAWALNNGTGAYYHYQGKSSSSTFTVTLKGSAPGYPPTATGQLGTGKVSTGGSSGLFTARIYLADGEPTAPTYNCPANTIKLENTNMCYTFQGFEEYRIVEGWTYSCK